MRCVHSGASVDAEGIAAILLLVGSVLFLIGAFMPVSRVFMQPTPAAKLAIIAERPRAWTASQALFGLGAGIAAIGLALVASVLIDTPGAVWASSGVVAAILGAAFWVMHVYRRAVDPEGFVAGRHVRWLFPAYALLTQLGLLSFGVAFLLAGFPAWLVGVTLGGAVLFFVVFFVLRDIPPFVYYVLTLIAGIWLVLERV